MQYCVKCKNIADDGRTSCPHCKQKKVLRDLRQDDLVYMMRAPEYDAKELAEIFEEQGIGYEIMPFTMGFVSSVYDSEIMPTDKNIYIAYGDLKMVQEIITKKIQDDGIEIPEKPDRKKITVQILTTLAFLTAVVLIALMVVAFFGR